MPFHRVSEMQDVKDLYSPTFLKQVTGEFVKIGVVTLAVGEEPPPHYHPNEEQFNYILQGRIRMYLGGEIQVVQPGDLVHIPRGTHHGMKILQGPMVFLNVKSPVGGGPLSSDYNEAPDAQEIRRLLGHD